MSVLDPDRLADVRATGLLDTPAEAAFDRLAEMAGALLDAPYAFVTLVDDKRSFWKSCIGVGASDPAERQNAVEESFCQYVVGTGEKLIVGDTRSDPRTRDNPSIESMGVAAWAGYPVLSSSGRVLGTFCVVDTRVREWTSQDERVLATLAESASREIALRLAIEDADDLARELQASLLPPGLPDIQGLEIAARYLPAGKGAEVAGDFYDVFAISPGRSGFAMGDVCGKGVLAATVTALARHTIRTAAMSEPAPDDVLRLLNRALAGAELPECLFLTAQFGVLEGRCVTLASAGHPPALLRRADGSVSEVPASGQLLGVFPEPVLVPATVELEPGETLLLYTDGVTEARGDTVLGETALRAIFAEAPEGADAIAGHIQRAVCVHSGEVLADDVALLVLKA